MKRLTDVAQSGVLQQRNVFRLLESLAGEAVQATTVAAVDFARTICHLDAHADLEALLEVHEVDAAVQAVVVELVEDGAAHLVGLEGDPVERRQFVFGLHLHVKRVAPVISGCALPSND